MRWPWSKKTSLPTADKIDGYAPAQAATQDPWAHPEVAKKIEERGQRSRFDAANLDGWKNELTGIGDFLRDKTLGGRPDGLQFLVNFVPNVQAEARWRGSNFGARIVETIPDEMTREWVSIDVQPSDDDDDDKQDAFGSEQQMPSQTAQAPSTFGLVTPPDDEGTEIVEAVESDLERLGAAEAFYMAHCYRRAYGGGAILVGADDGNLDDLTKPLDEERIKKVNFLNALSGGWDGEVVAWSYYQDPTQPNYGMPETYMLRNLGVPLTKLPAPSQSQSQMGTGYGTTTIWWVHESRLILFSNTAVSHRACVQMRGWGDSIFTRVDEVLQQYGQTWGGIANLMTDFSQAILSIEGLAQAIAANKSVVTSRAMQLNLSRSISRILMLDSNEVFKRDTVSLSGVAEVLQQFALQLAAAADMPVSLLFGQAPAGLNATGDSDIRFFYDRIASWQRKSLLPQMRRLLKLLFLAKDGPTDGVEPARWNVSACPLYQLTAVEEAARRKTIAETDQIYISTQVVTPEEVAAKRFGGSDYDDGPITIDFEGRAKMAEEQQRTAELQQQMSVAQSGGMPREPQDEEAIDIEEEPEEEPPSKTDTATFNEEDHPRAENGKFGSGGGGKSNKEPVAALKSGATPQDKANYHRQIAEHFKSQGQHELAAISESMARGFEKKIGSNKQSKKEVSEPSLGLKVTSQLKQTLAKNGVDAALKLQGIDPAKANALVQGWADHGGTPEAISLSSAWTAAAGGKIGDNQIRRMIGNNQQHAKDYEGELITHEEAAKNVSAAIVKGQSADLQKTAKAIAAVSQASFGNQTHVDVYRGISGAQAQSIRDALARGDKNVNIAVDSASSFTDSHASAKTFASGKGGQGQTNTTGLVIKMRVPVASIVLSHKAFDQLKGEDEIVLSTKGTMSVSASDIHDLQVQK